MLLNVIPLIVCFFTIGYTYSLLHPMLLVILQPLPVVGAGISNCVQASSYINKNNSGPPATVTSHAKRI